MIWMLMLAKVGFSQDLHFSQYFSLPLMLNPSNGGSSDFQLRFAMVQKQQWNSITRAYSSSGFSVDGNIYSLPARKLNFSAGLNLLRDVAGDGNFGMYAASVPLTIHFLPSENAGMISVAIEPGIIQYSLNIQDLVFDNQLDGSPASGEFWSGNQILLPDLGLGIAYNTHHLIPNAELKAGFSIKHFNKPSVSVDGTKTAIVSSRSTFFLIGSIPMHENQFLMPQLLYSNQKDNQEWLAGATFETLLSNQKIQSYAVGLHLRPADSFIMSGRIGWNDFQFGLSYDINYSGLFRSSYGRGGLEITLQYGINAALKVQPKTLPYCPTYL